MPAPPESAKVTVLDVFVFLDELVLLAVVAFSGAAIDAPLGARVALAAALVAVVGVVWGRWLSPRAPRPLDYPGSIAAKLVVFAVAAMAFAATGHIGESVAFLVVSAALVVASERERHRLAT